MIDYAGKSFESPWENAMHDMATIRRQIADPPLIAEKDQYLIKFAITDAEIEDAFKLRYNVFNVEQGKGLSTSRDGIDKDKFDDFCLHLIVVRKDTGGVVGTYRIHFGSIAAHSMLGFYSEQEYRIEGLASIAASSIEVGRSCVARDSRNGSVMALLWSGISELIYRSKQRYLLGCVSLEVTEPVAGWALYEYFKRNNCFAQSIRAFPREGYELARPPEAEILEVAADKKRIHAMIPPLFKGYLRLGAKICGEPAFDYEFGSIDFFIILDVEQVPLRYRKHFCVEPGKNNERKC